MWNLKFSLFDFKTSGFLISCKVTSYEGEEDINLLPIEGFVACGRQRAVIFLQRPSKFAMVRGPGHLEWRRLCFLSGQDLLILICAS